MRYLLMVLCLLFGSVTAAGVQVSAGISLPGITIGINLPRYPQMVLVPGYPVYYAPYLDLNYFFYDGVYWVYVEDDWYVSYWYNGPWYIVYPDYVPVFILRIPVYYYRRPPAYFYGWWLGGPPHWEKRWGRDWERRRGAWRHWDLSATPSPAPLPDYQRDYRDRYPDESRQIELHKHHYRYHPRDDMVREHVRRFEVKAPRQWQVKPPRDEMEMPPVYRQRIIVPPPEVTAPDRDDVRRWRQGDVEPVVPPTLQRPRPIRRDHDRRESDEREQESRSFRGSPGELRDGRRTQTEGWWEERRQPNEASRFYRREQQR